MNLAIANRFPSVHIQDQVVQHSINWNTDESPMTMLMCDLVGSTQLATSLAIRDFGQLLLDYYAVCFNEIEQQKGRVIRYVGDCVLGLFDNDEEPRKLAEQAIRAGVALRDRVSEMPIPSKLPSATRFAVRISIVSGVGVRAPLYGSTHTSQEVVFGKIPFLADRLKEWIEPDNIIVNEETAHLVQQSYCLDKLGIKRLKGFSEDVTAWRISGASEQPSVHTALRQAS